MYSLFDSWGRFVGYLVPNYSGCIFGWVLFMVLFVFGVVIFAPFWLIWKGIEDASKGSWGTALICWSIVAIPLFVFGGLLINSQIRDHNEATEYDRGMELILNHPDQAFSVIPLGENRFQITNNTVVNLNVGSRNVLTEGIWIKFHAHETMIAKLINPAERGCIGMFEFINIREDVVLTNICFSGNTYEFVLSR